MISLDSTMYRLGNLNKYQAKLSFQMGGSKLQYGSDDSVTFGRIVHTEDQMRLNKGIVAQIDRANVLNKSSDAAINEMKKIMDSITQQLIQANTSTTGVEGLAAIAQQLEGLKQNLFDLGNTQTEGQFVFAGSDASVKPFSMDPNGKVTYNGDSNLRKIAVDDGSYRERGVNGIDVLTFVAESAYKGGTLNFQAGDKITDQDGNEWVLNAATNELEKTNWDGSKDIIAVVPPIAPDNNYTAALPNTDGIKFEARRSTFDMLDDAIRSLKGLDEFGNPAFPGDDAANYAFRREGISQAVDDIKKVYDAAVIAHADLGGRNKTFEVTHERLSAKITQLDILDKALGSTDHTEVTMNLKALEISFAAISFTINKTFELSLVNFMR
ncbi:flagellar biosynthesis protein FlgL [Arcobacter porcinus]|uniref:Flagellar hook-associated protein FlgL n=1 Tax=Arcobacter porcinus TaxID=1935204 RepID=A0ABX2YFG8_9BACT|nr:flagellar biosynthesis protein FlgL [Arcobacter porcinus]OCL82952.1 flagellar hook-associated protein FlgL [Arcobacter porcinus]OCL88960.1 flagellar hook-associated protein FlgL [Arcobacter porcinus]OCL93598.1 flagellar hook-associated protein FlgL [Arcobacter porcinus]